MLSPEEFDELIKIFKSHIHTNKIWDLMNAQLLQCNNNYMIRISLIIPSITIDTNDNHWIEDFDDKIYFDSNTYSNTDIDKIKIFGDLDIVTHSTYGVLCPYVRLWYSDGCLLNLEATQSFLFSKSDHKNDDHEVEILMEEHPNGTPCFTFHVCGIKEYLNCMDTSNMKLLKFISWLTIIGRYIGINISPREFSTIQLLVKEKRDDNEHLN